MNVAVLIIAIIGAGLNLFQPVITMPVPELGLGASMFDIALFLINLISARALRDIGFVITLLIVVFLASVPAQAVKNGIYALQRRHDKDAVGGLSLCAAVYVIVALIIYFLPHLATSRAEDRLLMSYGLGNVIPFTAPLIWAACYAVAALIANTDRQYKANEPIPGVETPALIKSGNLFLEESNFFEARRYFEQALRQDPENSSAHLGKLMAELKIKNMDSLPDADLLLSDNSLFQRALRFASNDEKAKLEECAKLNAEKIAAAEAERKAAERLRRAGLSDFDIQRVRELPRNREKEAHKNAPAEEIDAPDNDEGSTEEPRRQEAESEEQRKIREEQERIRAERNKKRMKLIAVIVIAGAAIYYGVGYYQEYAAAKRAEEARIARIEAEKQEEKSRIEALKLELQGHK